MAFEYRMVRYPATPTTDPCVRVLGIYTDEQGRVIGSTAAPVTPVGTDPRELTIDLVAMSRAVTLPVLAFEDVYRATHAPAAWLAVNKAARA